MTTFFERCLRDAAAARRLFLWLLLLLTGLRAGLAATLPITGDEAYFLFWGRYPDWGFYDHPPMIGWWLALLDAAGSGHRFVLRLPALLVVPVVAAIAGLTLRRYGETLGWSAAILLLLVPLNAWNVAITTDVPLMLFAALTVALYLRACRSERPSHYLWAGLALAGALLSKYFAGLLAIAILAHVLAHPTRARLIGLACVVVGASPAAAIQITWNAQHCWPNLMFNLVNRHGDAGLSWHTPLLYLLALVYVLTPVVAWYLLRRRIDLQAPPLVAVGAPAQATPAAADRQVLAWLAGVPLLIFGLLSLVKTIGLHWLASFVMPAVLLFVLAASRWTQARAIAVAAVIAALHWLAIAVLVALPTETFERWRGYPGLVMTVHHDELAQALAPYRGRWTIAADGYSPAVTLGYNLGEYVIVFGPGSSHARHDDILTDFRTLAGRDILIVQRKEPQTDDYAPYFERIELRQVTIRGAVFHLIEGHGFRYEVYRDQVLDEVRRRWYAVPRWLPAGPCYFCDRYFPERACRR